MTFNKQKAFLLTALILLSAAAFFWARSYVFSNMGLGINQKLQSLKLSGFNVRYDSLSVNWLGNVVEIDHLVLEKNAYDTACIYPEFIAVGKVRAQGFRLFPLIFRNILSFEHIDLLESHVVMRQKSLLKLDSASQRENEFTLWADKVFIKSADFEYTDSLHCKLITGIKGDLTVEGLKLDFHVGKAFTYAADLLTVDSAEVKLPGELYTFQIRQAKADLLNKVFQADSIRVIPDLGKLEFGRKVGFETDRFEGTIPFVKVSDFSLTFPDSALLKARVAEVQFYMKIFRDKRLPFKKNTKLLPIAQIKTLPFGLLIDSLKITKSYIQYEELAEETPDPGEIYFDNLYAVISNINNQSQEGNMLLAAHAALMGQGKINLSATFPWLKSKRASMAGSLKDFSIPKINSMLTPATNLKVESGEMKMLSFKFSFDAVRSNGEIELNYEDLKLVTFKDEDKQKTEELEKDNFKSFIMNTFIFRKNMDERVPEEKRTGTVMFLRDDSRSIFNFIVKSVVSGVKSAYNLDKTEAKKIEREDKKEERTSRREARKLKKNGKKKDNG